MTTRILRLPDVLRRVGLRKSAIYAMIAAGKFPSPVKLGRRAVGWSEAAVDRWIAERLAAGRRDHDEPPLAA